MPKHNILYLHNKSDISGGERSLLGLWENLDQSVFSLILILPSEGDFSRHARQLGVKVIFYSFPQLSKNNAASMARAVLFLGGIILQEKVHLIHSHTARNNILASFIGRLMNVPVIWHERNILMKDEKDVTKKFLFLAHAVICNSQAVAGRLGPLPGKVKVILNGVDSHQFSPVMEAIELKKRFNCEKKMIVGIVSNLTIRRRVEYFIEAAALIKAQKDDLAFFIVGGEFEQESKGRLKELEARVKQLGLEGTVFFIGRQDDVRPWISMFDVSCHVTSQDACSRSILEAMSMSRAIVAMNDGGNPELIENNRSGILIGPLDQNGFVNAVLDLLKDQVKRNALSQAARKRVEQYFDIKQNTRQTLELYCQFLKVK